MLTTWHSLSAKVGTNLGDKWRSLSVGIVRSRTQATEFSFQSTDITENKKMYIFTVKDLRFSQQWLWRVLSSVTLRHVVCLKVNYSVRGTCHLHLNGWMRFLLLSATGCSLVLLVPYDGVSRNKVSVCQLPFYFPSHSLHVSAPTGHPQVRYHYMFLRTPLPWRWKHHVPLKHHLSLRRLHTTRHNSEEKTTEICYKRSWYQNAQRATKHFLRKTRFVGLWQSSWWG
jgi:hypothetical protein